jgi:hypothetical protein
VAKGSVSLANAADPSFRHRDPIFSVLGPVAVWSRYFRASWAARHIADKRIVFPWAGAVRRAVRSPAPWPALPVFVAGAKCLGEVAGSGVGPGSSTNAASNPSARRKAA